MLSDFKAVLKMPINVWLDSGNTRSLDCVRLTPHYARDDSGRRGPIRKSEWNASISIAGLAPGRPDEGVWAYVFTAFVRPAG
jgi:hypothetical protein